MALFFRSQQPMPEIGARFRPAQTIFGAQVPMVWSIEAVHRGSDGHDYALLVKESDRSRRKTVAITALRDTTLFVPVE